MVTPDIRPYGVDQQQTGNLSPMNSNRMKNDDIDGSKPNACGHARRFKGKDYMNIEDIPGAKSRYRELEERRAHARDMSQGDHSRSGSNLDVRDINLDKPLY